MAPRFSWLLAEVVWLDLLPVISSALIVARLIVFFLSSAWILPGSWTLILPMGKIVDPLLIRSLALSWISAYSARIFLILRLAYKRFAMGSPVCCTGWLNKPNIGMLISMMSAAAK